MARSTTPRTGPPSVPLTEHDRAVLLDHAEALRAEAAARALELETVRLPLGDVAKRLGATVAAVRQYAELAGIALPPPRRGVPEPCLSMRQIRDLNLVIDRMMAKRPQGPAAQARPIGRRDARTTRAAGPSPRTTDVTQSQ